MTFRIMQILSIIGILGSGFLLADGRTVAGLLTAAIFVGVLAYSTSQQRSRS